MLEKSVAKTVLRVTGSVAVLSLALTGVVGCTAGSKAPTAASTSATLPLNPTPLEAHFGEFNVTGDEKLIQPGIYELNDLITETKITLEFPAKRPEELQKLVQVLKTKADLDVAKIYPAVIKLHVDNTNGKRDFNVHDISFFGPGKDNRSSVIAHVVGDQALYTPASLAEQKFKVADKTVDADAAETINHAIEVVKQKYPLSVPVGKSGDVYLEAEKLPAEIQMIEVNVEHIAYTFRLVRAD